jgi:acyl-CoA hydrolase
MADRNSKDKDASSPQGELVIRTLAMPADANGNGDIFGGWVMAQMDMGGATWAARSSPAASPGAASPLSRSRL